MAVSVVGIILKSEIETYPELYISFCRMFEDEKLDCASASG